MDKRSAYPYCGYMPHDSDIDRPPPLPPLPAGFMTALEGLGESLEWHPNFRQRAGGGS